MSEQGTGAETSQQKERGDRLLRIGDILLACVLGLTTLPLFGLIALAIRLESSGPVFCHQPRLLADGRRVFLVAFRTAANHAAGTWDGSCQTRVGSFLRYTRIEHLPRLINVLRGEMTLVGTDRLPSFQLD